jgi:hypothetical protein
VVVTLVTVADWIAWITLVVSIAVLAWTGVRYVNIEKRKVAQAEFDNFYRTLERVHNKDQSLILQAAAVFELRNFPRYSEFIIRLCNNTQRYFPNPPDVLANEFNATRQFFVKDQRS